MFASPNPCVRRIAEWLCTALLVPQIVLPMPPAWSQSEPLGSIEGTVVDADSGAPIAGLLVSGWSIDEADRFVEGFTDEDGRFMLSQPEGRGGVVPGTYILLTGNTDVWESVYAPTWWRNARDREHADPVEVRAGVVTSADFELNIGGRITGTVTDASGGDPIAGVDVSYVVVSPRPLAGATHGSYTAADGTFDIAGLAELGYKVCFHRDGYRAECWRDAYLSAGPGGDQGTPGIVLEPSLGETIELAVDLAAGSFAGWFLDDDGSEFQRDIDWLAAAAITRGCNPPVNDRYCPDTTATRAQLAAMFHRAFPDLPVGTPHDFTDVGPLFAVDVEWLAATGVTKGCNPPDNTRFCPDQTLTRAQAAAMLVRALGTDTPAAEDRFTDDDGSEFESEIGAIAAAGITRGCNPPANDHFCPDATVTRAELAAFLRRALG